MFLPSIALSCNILKTLYENKDDSEVNKVLMQYRTKAMVMAGMLRTLWWTGAARK